MCKSAPPIDPRQQPSLAGASANRVVNSAAAGARMARKLQNRVEMAVPRVLVAMSQAADALTNGGPAASPAMRAARRIKRAIGTILAISLYCGPGAACPSCPIGRSARQQVYEQGFAMNLLIALVPFLLVGVVSIWADRIGKSR